MPPKKVTQENLLEFMARALFGDFRSKAQKTDVFRKLETALDRFHSDLQEDGYAPPVTKSGIHKWFLEIGATHPDRQKPIQFLNRYISSISVSSLPLQNRPYYYAVRDFLAPFGLPNLQPLRNEIVRVGVAETWAKSDPDALKRFQALAGTYQIIRPSSLGVPGRYVLEAMAVELDEERRRANLLMYSRSQQQQKYCYTGPLYVSYRYGYSLAHRIHEQNNRGFAMRAVSLYVGEVGNVRTTVSCLSGLLLRGVAAESGNAPTRAISVPFVAIKTRPVSTGFRSAAMLNASNPLKWLDHDSFVLIGLARNPDGPVFQFCDQLFSALNVQSRLVLHTATIEEIEKAIQPNQKADFDPLLVWKTALKRAIGGGKLAPSSTPPAVPSH